ncbi:MAG: bifunctional UDP-3-O-[3-hydroxymyristoyl] N-acetylglucosamine deacetylase/3-hydroxyacyl-ACP dehydratase [Bacteroidota bacterium]|nr:bifunctional UDP-3-O-[3-hydroxymyristoyl] N-acetylglucosamine deacetylase/3-hydroxyacyl-ACP dehydratase [Bacteroidota bacterium]
MKQRTIKNTIEFEGKGIHTGVYTKMKLIPAKENTGILFRRTELKDQPYIEANVDNVISTNRSTNLKNEATSINTVEHILASITGSSIDNVIIEMDNIEVPILDGSAKDFTSLIEETGYVEQNANKKIFEIKRKIMYTGDNGEEFIAEPNESFSIITHIDYNSQALPAQSAELLKLSDFKHQISESRTFCFLHELEMLLENNLIKGGDVNNAIVIVEDEITEEKKNFLSNIFKKKNIGMNVGILNNLTLRYQNEPARHKLLDVLGDLTLLGSSIKGKITVTKPGHTNNVKFTKKLKNIMEEERRNSSPHINFKKQPLYNQQKIKNILPHREPFLLIDEIREIGPDFIIGVKFVNKKEEYFKGHFPGEPVMPGVLQLETMAQAGGVLILNTVNNPEEYLTYFLKIDNAKFKQKVVPGDILIFRLDLISPIRRGLCHMHGKGFVNNQLVVEADLLAQITKK